MLEDTSDLAILAFGQLQFDPGVAAGAALHIGVDRAVANALYLDALDEILEPPLADLSEDPRPVGALDARGRKLELALQFAVGGEEEEGLGVEGEPADRHDPRKAAGKAVVD